MSDLRSCIHCHGAFEPDASLDARLQAKGRAQRVCPRCVLRQIDDYGKDPGYIRHIETALDAAERERDSARAQLEAWQARQPLMLAVIEAARDVCRSAPDIITREVQWMRLAMAIDALDGEGTKEAE